MPEEKNTAIRTAVPFARIVGLSTACPPWRWNPLYNMDSMNIPVGIDISPVTSPYYQPFYNELEPFYFPELEGRTELGGLYYVSIYY